MNDVYECNAYDRHREYLRGFIPLSLWYARMASRKEQVSLDTVIAERTNLYRNSVLDDQGVPPGRSFEDSRWADILKQIVSLSGRVPESEGSGKFETEGTDFLWPWFEPAIEKSLRQYREVIAESPFECWRYDVLGDTVKIHIANAYRPDSPLGSRFPDFRKSLFAMLLQVRSRYPEVTMVWCGSWMNSIPKFCSLFPEDWRVNGQVISQIGPGLGQWGQFMDRNGGFHAANGRIFRQSGSMPFACVECSSGLAEVLQHLGSVCSGLE